MRKMRPVELAFALAVAFGLGYLLRSATPPTAVAPGVRWRPALSANAPAAAEASVPLYRVRRIIDGDTLEIEDLAGIRTRVRLRRLDAPELDEPTGPQARDALAAKFEGRMVRVTPYARDRYGRLVADVELP
jgi:endonuclease YncB( thermonuclease family)